MKILQTNAGALTNFEVLDFLRSRGAANDPTRVLVSIAPSEFKVYDYLEQSAARDQTRKCIVDFMEKSKKFDLAKAEILNIVNIIPSSTAELYPIVENFEARLGGETEVEAEAGAEAKAEDKADKLVELVNDMLSPRPTEIKSEVEDASDDDDVETGEEDPNEQERETS